MPFSMNTDYYDFLLLGLSDHLTRYSLYTPAVRKKPLAAKPTYPQVVLSEITNAHDSQTTERRETISVLGYEVDIFSAVKVVGGVQVDSLVICRELAKLADTFMNRQGFRRLSFTPTPTVDITLYRIVMRYNARMFNNCNQIL